MIISAISIQYQRATAASQLLSGKVLAAKELIVILFSVLFQMLTFVFKGILQSSQALYKPLPVAFHSPNYSLMPCWSETFYFSAEIYY